MNTITSEKDKSSICWADVQAGDIVKVGDFFYMATDSEHRWVILETGKVSTVTALKGERFHGILKIQTPTG